MIKTKSIHEAAQASDGKRILVARFWPRQYSKETLCLTADRPWRREFAPSKQLLMEWKAGEIDWDAYVAWYSFDMGLQHKAIAALAKESRLETITLLCHEPEGDAHCHRHILKRLVEGAG